MKKEGASVVPRPQSEYNAVQWYSVPGSQAEDIGVSWGFNPKEHVGITYYDVTFTYWDTETQAYVSTDASEKIPSNEMSKIEEHYPVPIGTVVEIEGNKYYFDSEGALKTIRMPASWIICTMMPYTRFSGG